VRLISAMVMVAGLAFLSACGGSGTPAGIPITIALSASLTSLNPGQSSTITATVANDSGNKGVSWSVSPSGFGTLSNQTATSVAYTAPSSVPTATTATITATSAASPTVSATIQIAVQTSSITISLSPVAPQTINQGQQVSVNATLTNDTGNKGVTWSLTPSSGAGTLTAQTSTSVTYLAPSSVTSNTPVTLTAASVASSSVTATLEITVFPSGAGPNVAALTVDSGPAGNSTNLAFVSVTICVPGTQTCQTVDHVEVDTGSSGLRILESAIPGLSLPTLTDNSGNTIFNCVQFLDTSYLWGPVQQANIEIGGEVAGSALIQTISSSNAGIPTACTNGGTVNQNTPSLLAANGILGIGLEPTDCYAQGLLNLCDGSVQSPLPAYFDCPSSGCASNATQITIAANNQVTNPVVLFSTDNNGVVLQLPSPQGSSDTAPTLSGSLTFGIGTASNNGLGTATAFPLANDSFITLYSGQTLNLSFIDSGSNALFFPSSLTVCADNSAFYCPPSLTPQSATNEGANGTPVSLVNFNVDNADNLFKNNPADTAFGTLAGPQGTANTCTPQGTGSCSFDWGLPFFFGRKVFTAIDGKAVTNVGNGPFWAY
jgi:hypothetical protein